MKDQAKISTESQEFTDSEVNPYSKRAQEYMIWLEQALKEIKETRERYLASQKGSR